MNLGFVKEMQAVKRAINAFDEVKEIFELFAQKKVYVSSGDQRQAIEVAKKLLSQAGDHRIVIEMTLEALKDGKIDEEEKARLEAYLKAHEAEMSKFMNQVQALVGAEMEVIIDLLNKDEEAKK